MTIEKTLKERGGKYGTFDENAKVTQALMSVLVSASSSMKLTDMHREILHMICHKMSRMVCGDPFYVDNVHDIIGYAKGLENYLIKLEQEKDNDICKHEQHSDIMTCRKCGLIWDTNDQHPPKCGLKKSVSGGVIYVKG